MTSVFLVKSCPCFISAVKPQPGVRYITEDLIKKIAKEDNLDLITSLSLTLVGEKKIKVRLIYF